MPCRIDIGLTKPCILTVTLVDGAPFTSRALTRSDGSEWPERPALTFAGGVTWTATLSDDKTAAVFTQDSAAVEAIGGRGESVALHEPTTGRVWATGQVHKVAGVPA